MAQDPLIEQGNKAIQAVTEPQTFNLMNESVKVNPEGQVISVEQLRPAQPLTIPQPDYNPIITSSDSLVSGISAGNKTLQDYEKLYNPPTTPYDSQSQGLFNEMRRLINDDPQSLGLKEGLSQSSGLNDFNRQMAQLQGEIAQETAAYQTLDTKATVDKARLDNTGLTRSEYGGEANRIIREAALNKALKAADLTMLYAKQSALNGNIANAQKLVDSAVEKRNAIKEAELNTLQLQLDKVKEDKSQWVQNRAKAVQAYIDDEKAKLPDEKANQKEIGNLMIEAAKNGASNDVLSAIQGAKSLPEAIAKSGDILSLPMRLELQQREFDNNLKLKQYYLDAAKVNQASTGLSEMDLIAYAQQYAATGQIPTGLPKGTFGAVSAVAAQLPKPDGTLVDMNTGIKPGKLNATDQAAISAMYDLTKKLQDAKELFGTFRTGIVAGVWNKFFPTQEQTAYNTLRGEIVDLLSRARSGAALTETEIREYEKKLPSRYVKGFWTGPSGVSLLDNLQKSINGKLETTLKTNGLEIVGFRNNSSATNNKAAQFDKDK